MGGSSGKTQMDNRTYVGSVSGSLQQRNGGLDTAGFQKSPLLNTGKKLSNTSLSTNQRVANRSS